MDTKTGHGENGGYLTEMVKRGDIEDAITASGMLMPKQSVNVGAQVSGQLRSLKVAIGDHVEKGQLLAEIDPSTLEKRVEISSAQIDNLKAQLLSRQMQLVMQKTNALRQKTLLSKSSTSQKATDEAEAGVVMAEADVKSLEAQIRQQEAQLANDKVDLGYTKIYSPMDGVVVEQSAKEGETLNAAQIAPTVVTIANLDVMTVEAMVSEADVGKLKIGMPAYFTLLGDSKKRFSGKLRQIKPTPQSISNVVLYNALFDVDNPNGDLMLGMSAQVYFVLDEAKSVLLAPISALIEEKRAPEQSDVSVKVLDRSGSFVERHVGIGTRNRLEAEITSGLEEGDKVVVTNSADKNSNKSPQEM